MSSLQPAQISYRNKWLEARNLKAENLKLYPVIGNAMQPKFNDGDYVMVNTTKTIVEDHKTYGLIVRGSFKIRRLITMDNGDLSICCNIVNTAKCNEVIKKSKILKDVLILGLVVHSQGSIH